MIIRALPLLALVLLAGCSTVTTAVGAVRAIDPMSYFQREDVNMKEKNYAAADFLIDRGRGYVKQGHQIKAMPLLDVQEPRLITKFGLKIPEQVGERLMQLGYNVDLTAVNTDVNPQYAPTPQHINARPDFILSGSYFRKNSTLDVSLTIKDAQSGVERASFTFTLPRTGELRDESKPKPLIMKVQ